MNSTRGFYTSWETIINQKLSIGENVTLPTLTGKSIFTVKTIDNKVALVESSGGLQATLTNQGNNTWKYNHITWPKDLKVTVQIVK